MVKLAISRSGNRFSFWPFCVVAALIGTVASQSILDFFTLAMAGGIVCDFFKNRNETLSQLRLLGIEWAFAGYFIVVLLGYAINASPDAEVAWHLKKFTWVLNLYIYIYAFSKLRLTPIRTLHFFCWSFLALNLYAVATYVFHYDFFTMQEIYRVIGVVDSATYHAHGNAVLFVVFFALLYSYWEKLPVVLRSVFGAALILFFFSIFLTMTRGIWLSLFVSAFLICLRISVRKAVLFFGAGLIVLTVAYFSWPEFRERLGPRDQASSSERLNLFKVNVQMLTEYPFLGIGYGENQRRNKEYWKRPEWNMPKRYITSHAHNQYLNVLSTTGSFGFVFFVAFMLFFLRQNWLFLKSAEIRKENFKSVLLLACLWAQIEFWLACLTDVSFEYAKIRALLIFVWALVFALHRHSDQMLEKESA